MQLVDSYVFGNKIIPSSYTKEKHHVGASRKGGQCCFWRWWKPTSPRQCLGGLSQFPTKVSTNKRNIQMQNPTTVWITYLCFYVVLASFSINWSQPFPHVTHPSLCSKLLEAARVPCFGVVSWSWKNTYESQWEPDDIEMEYDQYTPWNWQQVCPFLIGWGNPKREESSLPTIHFQGRDVSFREGIDFVYTDKLIEICNMHHAASYWMTILVDIKVVVAVSNPLFITFHCWKNTYSSNICTHRQLLIPTGTGNHSLLLVVSNISIPVASYLGMLPR